MIYVQFTKESDNKAHIEFIHYMPFDQVHGLGKTAQELLEKGALVESEPKKEFRPGKQAMLFYNTQVNELFYEYVDIPIPEEHGIAQLEKTEDLM
ncbi:hypothetical protein [uncultured Brevibacillus sp.]|uniref:hypothetical protein n=1 Tax=uncultured Brevibacillus sp. TaxID=169970 RepID=UPI0025985909|nr:hypothetical protein [uncultured Brevibacillus sp.]